MFLNSINICNHKTSLASTGRAKPNNMCPLAKDTVSFGANAGAKIIDEATPLLEGFKPNQIEDFNNLSPNKLVLVHRTNYLPMNGQIKGIKDATKDEEGSSQYRSTIHFSLNHPVWGHAHGDWEEMKYAIIAPMAGILSANKKENIVGGQLIDFFIKGNVNLPENTVIVRHNPSIKEGKLKVIDASSEIGFENTKGIKIVESANPDIGEVTSMVIDKMGYSEIGTLDRKTPECWDKFAKKYGYYSGWHSYSPLGRSESLISCIKFASIGGDTWLKDEGIVDYQKEFLTVIDEIKIAAKSKNIELSYDIDTMKNIIEESQTPSKALERIKNEMHLIPIDTFKMDEQSSTGSCYRIINLVLGIDDMMKEQIQTVS